MDLKVRSLVLIISPNLVCVIACGPWVSEGTGRQVVFLSTSVSFERIFNSIHVFNIIFVTSAKSFLYVVCLLVCLQNNSKSRWWIITKLNLRHMLIIIKWRSSSILSTIAEVLFDLSVFDDILCTTFDLYLTDVINMKSLDHNVTVYLWRHN